MAAPQLQGLVLFEHYEKDGSLLVVTSDASAVQPLKPGDFIVKRPWSTAAEPEEFNRARGGSDD